MTDRVKYVPVLPIKTEGELRRALTEAFREHAKQINWATGHDVQTISASQGVAHDLTLVDAASGAVTCTLIPAQRWFDRVLRVKKIDSSSNMVKVVPTAGETVDGAGTKTISTQYTCLSLMSDGLSWYIVGTSP